MPKISLATDVSNWGLFTWPARTRQRLIISSILATVAAFLFGFWTADYILQKSTSVILNILIITSNILVVLLATYLQSILVGDYFFPGKWRERVILGHKDKHSTLDATILEDRNLEFIIVIVILFIANTMAVNYAAGGFLDQYHRDGFYHVQLRSSDPLKRIEALEQMAEPIRYMIWDEPGIEQAIINHLSDPDHDVRVRAIINTRILEITAARPVLVELVQSKDTETVRSQAAISLGHLGEDTTARAVVEETLNRAESPDLQIGMLRSLGFMGSLFSIPVVKPFIDHKDEHVAAYAYWALSQMKHAEARDIVMETISDPISDFRQCAALEALKQLATIDDTTWARRQFQRVEKQDICQGLIWEDLDGQQYHIIWEEPVRIKYLKIVANTNPFDHRDWIQRLVNDPSEDWRLREIADEILKQMNRIEYKPGQ